MTKIRSIVKNPGESPQRVELSHEGEGALQALQSAVKGMITTFYVPFLDRAGVTVWANDEGLLIGLSPNLWVGQQPIVGPVCFTSTNEDGDTTSLTDEQAEVVRRWLEGVTLTEADRESLTLQISRLG